MKKAHFLFLIAFITLFVGCNNSALNEPIEPDPIYNPQHYLFEDYRIFPESYDISFLLDDSERFTPSDQDVIHVSTILDGYLQDNPDLLDLKEYKVQFFGYLNGEGERNILANFFCDDFSDFFSEKWQEEFIFVNDGGNCFFNIKVNLDKKETFDLRINGEA